MGFGRDPTRVLAAGALEPPVGTTTLPGLSMTVQVLPRLALSPTGSSGEGEGACETYSSALVGQPRRSRIQGSPASTAPALVSFAIASDRRATSSRLGSGRAKRGMASLSP